MSRHRNIRSMNYDEGYTTVSLKNDCLTCLIIAEYDGYDDVYGHSVEDDYATSPSVRKFAHHLLTASILTFINL